MNMKKTFFIVLCFLCIVNNSCSLDNDEPSFFFVPMSIVEAEMPEAFVLDETYVINVVIERPNSCVEFDGFDIQAGDTTERFVVAFGSEYSGDSCVEEMEQITESFTFTCIHPESYTFKFWTGITEGGVQEYIEIVVPVIPE